MYCNTVINMQINFNTKFLFFSVICHRSVYMTERTITNSRKKVLWKKSLEKNPQIKESWKKVNCKKNPRKKVPGKNPLEKVPGKNDLKKVPEKK